jgi:hypothetical protein
LPGADSRPLLPAVFEVYNLAHFAHALRLCVSPLASLHRLLSRCFCRHPRLAQDAGCRAAAAAQLHNSITIAIPLLPEGLPGAHALSAFQPVCLSQLRFVGRPFGLPADPSPPWLKL